MGSSGTFVWHELRTHNLAVAKTFYGRLCGWKTRTSELPTGPYTVVYDGQRETGGIRILENDRTPPHWMMYLAVEDLAEAAKAVVYWGGNILEGPTVVEGAGELLFIVDNQGTPLILLQPSPEVEAPPSRPRPNAFCFYLLNVRNLEKAAKFYGELVGWELKKVEIGPRQRAHVFVQDRTRVATVSLLDERHAVPCNWLCGIGVRNLPATHQRAIKLGAKSIMPPTPAGKLGSMDVIADPSGAALCLYEPSSGKG